MLVTKADCGGNGGVEEVMRSVLSAPMFYKPKIAQRIVY